MSDELRSERVTIMMAASELKAVDDWSFAQRIRSRGEAIRRLIQTGLVQSHGSSCARALRAASDRDAPTDLRS
jgi:metal-responsive CopG/Arc/MetJ family transcriptional regulator